MKSRRVIPPMKIPPALYTGRRPEKPPAYIFFDGGGKYPAVCASEIYIPGYVFMC
jgi:hypothetical protein